MSCGTRAASALAAALGAVVACATSTPQSAGRPAPLATEASSSANPPVAEASLPAGDPYAAAVDAVAATGAQVWIETDLLRHWRRGPGPLAAAVARVAALARRPGVRGVKIADELGYQDGVSDPADGRRFLLDAVAALRSAAPRTRILIDVVVPELGCLPWRGTADTVGCASEQRARHPAAALTAVDSYVATGALDVLNLSVGLRTDREYDRWGVPRNDAMREAWQEAVERGWGEQVTLQARKALAHPGAWTGGRAAAERDVRTFVDVPLTSGASAVDVWTWRQVYRDEVHRLLDPGLQGNELWRALEVRSRAGAELWTHLSPKSVERDLAQDLRRLTAVFSVVFVAAGTG